MNDMSTGCLPKPAPKARVRRATPADDAAELILGAWSEWCRYKLAAQGFGGGVDNERGRLPRAPGTHGDPVLSEVLATAADAQGREQLVHEIIGRYPRAWRKVAWARWVGGPEVKSWRKQKFTGKIEIAPYCVHTITVEGEVPASYRWSGFQPFIAVEQQTLIPLRTCERIAAQLKRLLVLDVAAAEHGLRATRTNGILKVGG